MKTNILFLLPIIFAVNLLEGSRDQSILSLNNGSELRLDHEKLPRDLSSSIGRFFDANSFALPQDEKDAIQYFMVSMIMDNFKESRLKQYDLRQTLLRSWNTVLGEKDMPGVNPAQAADAVLLVLLEGLREHDALARETALKTKQSSNIPRKQEAKKPPTPPSRSWADEPDPVQKSEESVKLYQATSSEEDDDDDAMDTSDDNHFGFPV